MLAAAPQIEVTRSHGSGGEELDRSSADDDRPRMPGVAQFPHGDRNQREGGPVLRAKAG